MKKVAQKNDLKHLFKDGQTIMVGGFMTCGTPEGLIDLLVEMNVRDLTIICNDAGLPGKGVGKLLKKNQVK
ncbi:MAG TPA: CoA-transferase, partial [Candidatus Ozemobacteraceae bacterium]|nr:CoA-transferase [Candidatus Ozemobacteraceae bacterium]